MNVITQILQAGQLISTLAPITLELGLKFKKLLAPLGPDVEVNIRALDDEAVKADEDTIQRVNDWLAANAPASTPSKTEGTPVPPLPPSKP